MVHSSQCTPVMYKPSLFSLIISQTGPMVSKLPNSSSGIPLDLSMGKVTCGIGDTLIRMNRMAHRDSAIALPTHRISEGTFEGKIPLSSTSITLIQPSLVLVRDTMGCQTH